MAKKNPSIKPVGGHILVKATAEDKTTKSGIIIPDTASEEKPQTGEVVALGTGKVNEDGKTLPFSVKQGDKVIFKKYSPEEIEVDGEKYLILEETDILAVINN